MVAKKNLAANNLNELVALMRKQPDKVNRSPGSRS